MEEGWLLEHNRIKSISLKVKGDHAQVGFVYKNFA